VETILSSSQSYTQNQQSKAKNVGLVLALLRLIALLFGITWLAGLTEPLLSVFDFDFTYIDIILMAGGLFLIYKSTTEIHHMLEGEETDVKSSANLRGFTSVIFQIIPLDVVFSIDSILTAVTLVDNVMIMTAAVIISIGIMILAAGKISKFVNKHPTVKTLTLSFLLLIGLLLLVEGFHVHGPKGYIYFAIFFSLVVELLNIRIRKKSQPVRLKERFKD